MLPLNALRCVHFFFYLFKFYYTSMSTFSFLLHIFYMYCFLIGQHFVPNRATFTTVLKYSLFPEIEWTTVMRMTPIQKWVYPPVAIHYSSLICWMSWHRYGKDTTRRLGHHNERKPSILILEIFFLNKKILPWQSWSDRLPGPTIFSLDISLPASENMVVFRVEWESITHDFKTLIDGDKASMMMTMIWWSPRAFLMSYVLQSINLAIGFLDDDNIVFPRSQMCIC